MRQLWGVCMQNPDGKMPANQLQPFKYLNRIFSRSRLLVMGLLTMAGLWAFNLSSLPFSNPSLVQISGGPGLLDLRPYYTADTVYTYLAAYTEAGRVLYIKFIRIDLVFIPVYMVTLFWLLGLLAHYAGISVKTTTVLQAVPLLTAVLDMLETLSILLLIKTYPDKINWVANTAGVMTAGKQTGIVMMLISILILLITGVRKR